MTTTRHTSSERGPGCSRWRSPWPHRPGSRASRSSSWCRPAPAAAPTRWRASSRAWRRRTSSPAQPIIVVNKSGGAGAGGFLDVKGDKGNPHKIIITLSNLFTTPLATGVPFNWRDLTPVQMLALDQFVLWVNESSPYKTAKAYYDAVKAGTPNQFKMGGTGSKQEKTRSSPSSLEKAAGKKMTTSPSRGGGDVAVQLVGNTSRLDGEQPIEADRTGAPAVRRAVRDGPTGSPTRRRSRPRSLVQDRRPAPRPASRSST